MQIKDVMTQNVQVIAPNASIVEAARMMKEQDTGFLPVCDGNKILGTVTDRDIVVRTIAQGLKAENTPVKSAMTTGVSWCFDTDDVKEAADKMKDQQIRRLIVVDQNKKLVGVVSLGDLATDVGESSLKAETLTEISKPGHNPGMAQRGEETPHPVD